MAAATAATTLVFQVYVPATRGYFNLGESMVYISALLFGPIVGAFSGGVGSMLADVLSGYYQYAPGTLVIKGIEGLIVGWLAQRARIRNSKSRGSKPSTLALVLIVVSCAAIGVFLALMGISGVTFTFFDSEFIMGPVTWLIISSLAALLVAYVIYRFGVGGLILTLSMLAGGAAMVIGYLLYELPMVGIAAIAEVPVNIMQCVSGIVIALPVFRRVRQAVAI
jgi:uncharacterized membrane protein